MMEKKIEEEGQNSENNNKLMITLNDLMDDKTKENIMISEMYEEYGDLKDKIKQIQGIGGNPLGRYKDKYIHYIMRNGVENYIKKKNK